MLKDYGKTTGLQAEELVINGEVSDAESVGGYEAISKLERAKSEEALYYQLYNHAVDKRRKLERQQEIMGMGMVGLGLVCLGLATALIVRKVRN